MRTVRDVKGIMWICLELPEVPADQQPAAAALSAEVVAVECNSGAHRVIALLEPGWDENLGDADLAGTILRTLALT